MLDENYERQLTRAETAYEDYVISLMSGKTAEQVDETEFTQEQLDRAKHYARNVKMFGKLNDPEKFEQNYLEEVVKNGPDVREFEAEMEYRAKYGEDAPGLSKSGAATAQGESGTGAAGVVNAFLGEILDGGLGPREKAPPDEIPR